MRSPSTRLLPTYVTRLCPVFAAASSSPALAAAPETGLGTGGLASISLFAGAGILLALLLHNRAMPLLRAATRWLGRRRILKLIRQNGFDVLDNFILPGASDGLTRIDYAVLTSAGIVCIRANTCNGTIFGGLRDPQWSNVDGVDRFGFLNPVIQNEGRARAISRTVGDMPVVNLVVFCGDTQFSIKPADNVIHLSELQSWLQHYQNETPSARDPEAAWLTLRATAKTDAASRKDFAAQLSFG
jgi:Nuclease-related domain